MKSSRLRLSKVTLLMLTTTVVTLLLFTEIVEGMKVTAVLGNISKTAEFLAPSFDEDEFHFNITADVRLPRSGRWEDCSGEMFDDNSIVLVSAFSASCYPPRVIKACNRIQCPGIIIASNGVVPGFWSLFMQPEIVSQSSIFVEVISRDGDWMKAHLESDPDSTITANIQSGDLNVWRQFIDSTWQKIFSTFVMIMSIGNICFILRKLFNFFRTRSWPSVAGFLVLFFEVHANVFRCIFLYNLGWCQCLSIDVVMIVDLGSVTPLLLSRISLAMCWFDTFVELTHRSTKRYRITKTLYFVIVFSILVFEAWFGIASSTKDKPTGMIISVFYCLILFVSSVGFIWQHGAVSNTGYLEMGKQSLKFQRIVKRSLFSAYLVLLFSIGTLATSLPWRGRPQVYITIKEIVLIIANIVSLFNIDAIDPLLHLSRPLSEITDNEIPDAAVTPPLPQLTNVDYDI